MERVDYVVPARAEEEEHAEDPRLPEAEVSFAGSARGGQGGLVFIVSSEAYIAIFGSTK